MRTLINARLAGALYLVIIVLGVFSQAVVQFGITVPDDPAATGENLRDLGWLLRLAFVANFTFLLCEVVLTVILYLLFRPVNVPISLVAAASRLAAVTIQGLNLLNMFAALLVLEGPDRPEAFALLFLDLHQHGLALALTFFALNCVAMGYLLARSSHAPTALGVLLGVAGLGYLTNSLVWFVVPGYADVLQPVLLAPAFVAEIWFCLLLLRGGGGPAEWVEPKRNE
jgi:hypothetical protein